MKNYISASTHKIVKNFKEFFYEHPIFKAILEYILALLASLVSAFCFAYGFISFISPGGDYQSLISGGASGMSQVLVSIVKIFFHVEMEANYLQSIFYILINIPLFFLAFYKIGKRFAILSLVNVALVSLFIAVIPQDWTKIFDILDDNIARALFAGILTGLSSSIAIKFEHSAGGIDIISLYLSGKRQTSLGKYVLMLNTVIVITYVLLNGFVDHATMALYTIVYFFTSSMVINTLCLRNKKMQLQIITTAESLAKVLIQNFPHSCTIVDGKGAYSGTEKKVILIVLSYYEVKRAIKVIKEADPTAFVTVMHTDSVYGKFFIQPLK